MLHTVATGAALLACLAATAAVPSSSSATAALPSSATAALPSSSAAAPPPKKVLVSIVSANGSGCPAGGMDVETDGTSFTLTYKDFAATTGPGSDPLDSRKNCQLALDVRAPQSWTWGIDRIVTRGTANLQSGASGTQSTAYYWAGDAETDRIAYPFTGPVKGPWNRTHKIAKGDVSYLPCGASRYLNVNFELKVDAGTATGRNALTMNSTSGSDFHVLWRKC
ncbi:DUF4360 domain-containing protein [Actinoplanes sichuanensis]|uniref:DUF4360 domain-containing protein n=1 Tax=Actinoplanes sichuanensis TaxID=512349 RepID=A0ABW4AX70_9ACTN|nr:DUF4360 domain-containing protein [Actinoplanes sichuanensis]BEL05246.1 DUF4360 domain-containing protein [Actinoplanes sichuanensis]